MYQIGLGGAGVKGERCRGSFDPYADWMVGKGKRLGEGRENHWRKTSGLLIPLI